MVTLVLKVASWVVFGVGLYLSGKLTAPESIDPDTLPLAIRADRTAGDWDKPLSLEPDRDGELEVRLALLAPEFEAELARVEEWIKGEVVRVDVVLRSGDSEDTWRLGPKVEVVGSHGAENLLILGAHRFHLEAGETYELTASMDERDGVLMDYGRIRVGPLSEDTTYDPKKRDRVPGLLVLGGGLGVFMHVFFILARLAIPMRPLEDLLLDD